MPSCFIIIPLQALQNYLKERFWNLSPENALGPKRHLREKSILTFFLQKEAS